VRKAFSRTRFETELALLNGTHQNRNNHTSIIHFSFNKAATQYIKSILQRCAAENGMVSVGFNEYAFHSDFPYLDHLTSDELQEYSHVFRPTGYLYSVFGGMITGIPHLESYKVVLVARDPRDILVSNYYSTAFSHPLPTGEKRFGFRAKRAKALSSTIDEFVLSDSERLLGVFERYQELLLDGSADVYLTTYEKMVDDFNDWLAKLIHYCDLSISSGLMQSLQEESAHRKPKKENVRRHVRKGQPGDHVHKLKRETVEELNGRFASVLARFGYDQ
jgi:hypothetical protein